VSNKRTTTHEEYAMIR